jgi:hypothetical protein
LEPISFHGLTVVSTKILVEHKITALMSSQALSANTAVAPLERVLPNPKLKLKDQFHEVARFKHLSFRTRKCQSSLLTQIGLPG